MYSFRTSRSSALFLSTPSARRATDCGNALSGLFRISIHALREEGDDTHYKLNVSTVKISIHALREEGDDRQTARL